MFSMNSKVLFLSLLFSSGIFTLSAQDELSRDLIPDEVEYGQPNQTYNTYKTTWKKNAFKDNWTISVGVVLRSYLVLMIIKALSPSL